MSAKLIRLITPALVAGTLLSHPAVSAADAEQQESVTTRLSSEVYKAISDLMALASDFRGDKPDSVSAPPGQVPSMPYFASNNSEMGQRVSNLRTAMKSNAQPTTYGGQYSELTLYQDGLLGEQNYSRLGAYFRVNSNVANNESSMFATSRNQEQDGYSLTLGGDYLLNDHYLFGLALGLPFYDDEHESTESDIDGLVASGYFSYFQNDWYVDFTASYALMDTDIERRISHYSDTVINNANEADSDIWVFSLGGGYVIDYNYLNIAFESSFQYTLSDTDRYAERLSKGNANYLISKVENVNNLESTMLITGVSISHPVRSSLGIFQPYVRGYIHYDIDSGSERIISQLKADHSGSVLPIIVNSDDAVYGRMHFGLSGAFNEDWHGYAEASTLIGLDELSASSFTVGVSMSLN
ncbi:hypothetical protein BIT28_03910 [Photobacterium proteolyticum]|uniref:Autotransporter domain-containing protein n=1 Tax=Photobacterium proteolyticum TaxID=1903952 RepID=A0A1Q9GAK6_9GAMM|nr:autotransporter outer membrane beta-barrel domain-containing protein [Photobacterium proteolyticum]OLQ71310.1 hypothetical protein BIT28_03910 [Photobacterium proteolyticum]